jgi:ribonuclease HI
VQEKEVEIYTDGACSGNPGPGGWGVVLLWGGHRRELSGGEAHTTNQRMELTAAIKGLQALKHPCRVRLYSDSAYLVNAFNQKWLERWIKNGWQTVKKTPVENRDLWEELYALTKIHRIRWIKVQGHAGNKENEHCDKLAVKAMTGYLSGESS